MCVIIWITERVGNGIQRFRRASSVRRVKAVTNRVYVYMLHASMHTAN